MAKLKEVTLFLEAMLLLYTQDYQDIRCIYREQLNAEEGRGEGGGEAEEDEGGGRAGGTR